MRESVFRRSFGRSIRSFREAAGVTQREVAERAGVADKYLSRIELGLALPSIFVAFAISRALGVGLEELVKTASQAPSADAVAVYQRVRKLSPSEARRVRRVVDAMLG